MLNDPNVVNWDDCPLEKITEMVSRRAHVDRESGTTFVQSHLRKGVLVPQHTHAGVQSIHVMRGSIVVKVAGVVTLLQAGEACHIPARIPHEIEALDDAVVVDIREGGAEFLDRDPTDTSRAQTPER